MSHLIKPPLFLFSSLIGKVEGLKKRAATPADAKKHPGAKDIESGRLTYELFPSGTSAVSGQTVKVRKKIDLSMYGKVRLVRVCLLRLPTWNLG